MRPDQIPLYRFWEPRYWPAWVVLGLMRIIVWLPQGMRMAVGRSLGRLALRTLRTRRHVARRNLELCFPELGPDETEALLRRHFESLGMGVVELGMAWWCSDREIARLTRVSGLEHVDAAMSQNKGAVMVSGHFAATEIGGAALIPHLPPMAAMYRPSDNPMNDQIMRRCRGRSIQELITKDGIRKLIKLARGGWPIWYAADQAYTGKGAVVVPFFGVPATANTALTQIVKLTGAPVVPFVPRRMENGRYYDIRFLAPWDEFPGADPESDAERVNHFLETQIREAPEQYYWVHRRFKNVPGSNTNPYKKEGR